MTHFLQGGYFSIYGWLACLSSKVLKKLRTNFRENFERGGPRDETNRLHF